MSNDHYLKLIEGQARIEQKIDNYKEIQDRHSKDLRNLNRFRWGIIGTGIFSIGAFLKSWLGIDS